MNQWKNIVEEQKKKKAAREAVEKKRKEELDEKIKSLPYFTDVVRREIEMKDASPAHVARVFIHVLQRHPEDEADGVNSLARLINCANIGLDLSNCLFRLVEEKKRNGKFIALKTALDTKNPELRK